MNVRILSGLTVVFLLAGCEQAPFEQHHAVACEEGSRAAHATVVNDNLVVGCNSGAGKGTVNVFRSATGSALEKEAGTDFEDRVLAVAPWPSGDNATGFLVALGGSQERKVMYVAGKKDDLADPVLVHETRFEVSRMLATDMNGDQLPDLVMPEHDTWLLNEGAAGSPEFTQRQSLDRSARLKRVLGTIIDLGADGREDGSYIRLDDGVVRVYTAGGHEDIVLNERIDRIGDVLGGGDINGDGHTDLVVSAKGMPENKHVMLVLSGNGREWTLSEPVADLVNPATVLARDFDGDGNIDLLAAPKSQGGDTDYSLEFLPGRGDATFGGPMSIRVENFPYRMIGGSQGDADVLFLDENGRLGMLFVTL